MISQVPPCLLPMLLGAIYPEDSSGSKWKPASSRNRIAESIPLLRWAWHRPYCLKWLAHPGPYQWQSRCRWLVFERQDRRWRCNKIPSPPLKLRTTDRLFELLVKNSALNSRYQYDIIYQERMLAPNCNRNDEIMIRWYTSLSHCESVLVISLSSGKIACRYSQEASLHGAMAAQWTDYFRSTINQRGEKLRHKGWVRTSNPPRDWYMNIQNQYIYCTYQWQCWVHRYCHLCV